MNRTSIGNLRRQYTKSALTSQSVNKDPIKQFEKWFSQTLKAGLVEPNAMIVATSTPKGKPSARVVLLKGLSDEGFIFFTNYESKKGSELIKNPNASLLFYWDKLERQVRIEGKVKKISRAESAMYFNSRPHASRIAAWSSHQSSVIKDRKEIDKAFKKFDEMYPAEVPLPDYWGGFILIPNEFEFWQGRLNRMHDRIKYKKSGGKWKISRLAP